MSAGRGSMREAMPGAAALVDQLRTWLGVDVVDQALRNGIALQRGGAMPAGAPAMRVREAGRVVGALPARAAGACPLCGDGHSLSQCKRWMGRAAR